MDIYFKNGDFEILEDNKRMVLNENEFLSYMKDNKNSKEKYYVLEEVLFSDIEMTCYVYKKLRLSGRSFYKMHELYDFVQKHNFCTDFDETEEYFCIEDDITFSNSWKEIVDYYKFGLHKTLEDVFMKDSSLVCDIIIEFIENK